MEQEGGAMVWLVSRLRRSEVGNLTPANSSLRTFRGRCPHRGGGVRNGDRGAAPLGGRMIVIVSWYADGSGQPEVRFRDVRAKADPPWQSETGVGLLVADIRETRDRECRVYEVGESVSVLYDSTMPAKERKQ